MLVLRSATRALLLEGPYRGDFHVILCGLSAGGQSLDPKILRRHRPEFASAAKGQALRSYRPVERTI